MTEKTAAEFSFKPRVLVIDDENRIRDGCQKTLEKEGFDVATAESGHLGLKMIQEKHFDIILLDLMMPGLSGMSVLTWVKEFHPDTAVIVITGYATLEHAVEAMKKGAFDFMSKPFSPKDLRELVSKALDYIRTLQDIATEKSRMRALINYLAGGVMATDMQKKIALANPAFLKMMDYRGESVGRPVTEIIRNEELIQMIDQALAMPEDESMAVTRELTLDGNGEDKETIVGAQCVPFRDRIGRNLGTLTVLHDITALKKMDQLKSDFVSMVSHEIRGPLNSILAQLKVVLDGLAGDLTEKQQDILGRTSQRIQALSDLSTDLLDLAKIESGLITQEKGKLNMADLLEDQLAFHEAKAQDKNIGLELEPLPELPPVVANRRNMEEVLSNLISNAISYTPEGGKITLSAAEEDNYLCIQVSDTGIGIPKDELNRIFDRFYRVKSDKTRFIAGTGLGLAIVKSIVEAHNGMIRIESEPDRGTTFYIYFPIINT